MRSGKENNIEKDRLMFLLLFLGLNHFVIRARLTLALQMLVPVFLLTRYCHWATMQWVSTGYSL